jgi:fermentation-respiration switch protein FrsA (DUF1100 family)
MCRIVTLATWKWQRTESGRRVEVTPLTRLRRASAGARTARPEENHEHTTLAESQELFEAAAERKQIWIVEGAKHQDLLRYDPKGYEDHVVEFLNRNLIDVAPSVPDVR